MSDKWIPLLVALVCALWLFACSGSTTSVSADALSDQSLGDDTQDQSLADTPLDQSLVDASVDQSPADASVDQSPADGSADQSPADAFVDQSPADLVAEDSPSPDVADLELDAMADVDVTPPSLSACNFHSDCPDRVRYVKDVAALNDCYCTYCDSLSVELNRTTHDAYKASWETVCAQWSKTTCTADVICAVPNSQLCLFGECRRPLPAPSQCNKTEDCVSLVVYSRPVYSEDQCYCPACDNGEVNLHLSAHAKYQTMYNTLCTEWAKNNGCAPVNCLVPAPARECRDNVCVPVTAPVSTTSCEIAGDCTVPVYHKPVKSMDDCYCPACPVSNTTINKGTHTLYQNQWIQLCSEWAKRLPCPVPSCVAPPTPLCESQTCKVGR